MCLEKSVSKVDDDHLCVIFKWARRFKNALLKAREPKTSVCETHEWTNTPRHIFTMTSCPITNMLRQWCDQKVQTTSRRERRELKDVIHLLICTVGTRKQRQAQCTWRCHIWVCSFGTCRSLKLFFLFSIKKTNHSMRVWYEHHLKANYSLKTQEWHHSSCFMVAENGV